MRWWISIFLHNVLTHPCLFFAEVVSRVRLRPVAVLFWRAHEATRGELPAFDAWCETIDARQPAQPQDGEARRG